MELNKTLDFSNTNRILAMKLINENHTERITKRRYDFISKKIDSLKVDPPPHGEHNNLSQSLLKLKAYQQSVGEKESIKQAKIYDTGMVERFKRISLSLGCDFPEDLIKGIKKEIGDFILEKKYYYDVPRPYQVARDLKIPLLYLETETSNSPSYPSGHAAQSWVIAEILTSLYPDGEGYFKNLARSISLSRVLGGLHFFEDIDEGRRIAKRVLTEGLILI